MSDSSLGFERDAREPIVEWSETYSDRLTDRWLECTELGAEVLDFTSDAEVRRGWALLVYAVGNVKRTAGNLHPPTFAERAPRALEQRPDSFVCPARSEPFDVSRTDSSSWRKMEYETHGLGVATATTVLAALWPTHHAICDRYTFWGVASLLSLNADPPGGIDPSATRGIGQPNWSAYDEWWLPAMAATCSELSLQLWELERALWLTYRSLSPSGMTWADTGRELREMLLAGPDELD